ncbi:hypothetical protein [Celeribacter sp.]|uniref:hypothetical protein n=1 Tax=Celeribacter sp. TaxID=1890673 RepID=UPI003A950CE7
MFSSLFFWVYAPMQIVVGLLLDRWRARGCGPNAIRPRDGPQAKPGRIDPVLRVLKLFSQ